VFAASERATAAAPDWEEPHHLFTQALAWWGWSVDLDEDVEQARQDGAWGEVLRWVDAADEGPPDIWHSDRADAREQALQRLERSAEASRAHAEGAAAELRSRPARTVRARFGRALELTGLDLPPTAHPGDAVTVRFGWRLSRPAPRDYAVQIRLVGPVRELGWEHAIGARYHTARWAPGERVYETVIVTVPEDAPPGTYSIRIGVREKPTGTALRIGDSDLPAGRRSVLAGTLTVGP
jgi:hypothetical protein